MWLDNFKNIIKIRGIKINEMAEISGMSPTGFRQGYNAGTLRFDVMMKLLQYYKINYYSIIDEEYYYVNETQENYEKSLKKDPEKSIILEALKKNYEDRIKKCEEYNEHLLEQINFLQQIIAKNFGLGEPTSNAS